MLSAPLPLFRLLGHGFPNNPAIHFVISCGSESMPIRLKNDHAVIKEKAENELITFS